MAITINGSGTLTGISAGGLPDGVITTDDIAASAVTSAKLAAGAGGKILQVVQATKTDAFSTTSTSFTDVTGLSVSITPSSASNKVLLLAMISFGGGHGENAHVKVLIGSSDLLVGDAAGSRIRANFTMANYNVEGANPSSTFTYLHSPASTSAQTYKVQIRSGGGGTVGVNRTGFDGDTIYYTRTASTMVAMEVAA